MATRSPDPDPIEVEYTSLLAQVVEQRERADRLRALAHQIDENATRDERLLEELAALVGRSPQMRLEDLDQRLGGQRLREVAVEILRGEVGPGQAIHYREWFSLLAAAGYKVGGRDPLATFLAQVHRTPDIEPVGQRTGRFRLVA